MPSSHVDARHFKAGFFTILKFVVFLGLGIFITWLSLKDLSDVERQEIVKAFRTANYNWVILGIALGICSHILRALRWMMFMNPMGYNPRFRNSFYAVMIGYLANLAFPRLGEVTRCGILTKYEKIPFNRALGTVITERAIDMLIFFSLFALMIVTQMGSIQEYLDDTIYPKLAEKFGALHYSRILWLTAGGFMVFFTLLIWLFRHKLQKFKLYQKIRSLAVGFYEGLKSLTRIKRPWLFILYSLSIWALYYLMLYVCFFCFPATSDLSLGAGLSALVLGSIGIMITPGGIGLYPALIQETLKLYGIALVTGLALGWIVWATQTLMILVLGGGSLLMLSFNKINHGTTREDKGEDTPA
ncbi:MAG: flippase-like domain-containing protein [Bacteroidales bacterium]|nr:flippase-like domain-containing protein [Bacteroidales bacterium]